MVLIGYHRVFSRKWGLDKCFDLAIILEYSNIGTQNKNNFSNAMMHFEGRTNRARPSQPFLKIAKMALFNPCM